MDQIVNPKINSIFLSSVEDEVYKYMGVERPAPAEDNPEQNIDMEIDQSGK